MFDPVTAALLRSAPELPGLNPAALPQTLTRRYAELIARRLRRTEGEEPLPVQEEGTWPLTRIADVYELITSTHDDPETRRAAAFVAGTAQQILHQEAAAVDEAKPLPILDRDRVDPVLAASLLFLAAEQYADASEAARQIRTEGGDQDFVVTLLAEDIRDLAGGNLGGILERAGRRPGRFVSREGLEERGYTALLTTLLIGIELFAAEVLGRPRPAATGAGFDTGRSAFLRVLSLSSNVYESGDTAVGGLLTTYPGPRHLASLLLTAYDGTASAATTKIEPPPGIDGDFWNRWLAHRATTAPFLWRNHREAVGKGFHLPGKSAVMVLPTGAGKTTVSCLKIAAVLAKGKNVVFIAPTHALVEQLTDDLQAIFPESILGSAVSSDFDRLFASGMSIGKIEIMTPERCLALLSYAPQEFADVGLLAFDECHLLSPISGLRRALDGMFCVLAFNSIAPDADFLFLSAMIRNGEEFAEWVQSLTDRECVFVDPLWKPSRQARGVVFYQQGAIQGIRQAAIAAQRAADKTQRKIARGLRTVAKAELVVEPYALFGLQHNWLHERTIDCAITKLLETPVSLSGELRQGNVVLKPNVNNVAGQIAAACARNRLKTIVFVNVRSHTVSTAKAIAAAIGTAPMATPDEAARWQALEAELGGLQHSLLEGPSAAVAHNGQMLRLERDLAERMFRRADGAQVIVATPTLAQGLNLPAHLAILASDMRADPNDGGREALSAHEILNAAARAGRAGHLANGVVLLIPEAVLTFVQGQQLTLSAGTVDRLKSILPEDDRCLDMTDPLQVVLDRINNVTSGDPDIEYALNRLSTAVAPEGTDTDITTRFSVQKSLAAYMAVRRGAAEEFERQIARLREILNERNRETGDRTLLELAAQSGAPVSALLALRERLAADAESLPEHIPGWVSWVIDWLSEDEPSRLALLGRERRTILGAVGSKMDLPLGPGAVRALLPGVLAWLSGRPLKEIEAELGGDPVSDVKCPRARHLLTSLVPMGLSFVMGLVIRTALETKQIVDGAPTPRFVMDSIPSAVRRGFDTPSKLAFADVRKGLLSRVQLHRAFAAEVGQELETDNTDDYGSLVGKMRALLGS